MKFLINMDLEGVNFVEGVPYEGLGHHGAPTEQYHIAIEQAVLEVNTVAAALFDSGAETVAFWDNHGGGNNVDLSKLDSRLKVITKEEYTVGGRMDFADTYGFDAMFLIGYHSMEGTLGGILAHTMNSKEYQYVRIGGKDVGEIEMDSYIASSKGIPLAYVSSDDKGCIEAYAFKPDISTVITKTGLSRNQAIFRDNAELLTEMYETAKKAASVSHKLIPLSFPAVYEIRYTRTERAAKALVNFREKFGIEAAYNGDAHTLMFIMHDIADLQNALRV